MVADTVVAGVVVDVVDAMAVDIGLVAKNIFENFNAHEKERKNHGHRCYT